MKPWIGVTPDYNPGQRKVTQGGEPTYYLRARYIRAIRDAGGIPVILPPSRVSSDIRASLSGISALVLTGSGPDIDPRVYGEKRKFRFELMSRERSDFERLLIRSALRRDLPILGICGGMQVLNVALGGTLIQDIGHQVRDPLNHRRGTHGVRMEPDSLLHRILRRTTLRVNTSHHQAIRRPGRGLIVSAYAPDGVIEGIEFPAARLVLGVQWHPEIMSLRDGIQARLFRALIAAAK